MQLPILAFMIDCPKQVASQSVRNSVETYRKTLYALSKNGNVRVYEISVVDYVRKRKAVLTTRKKTTLNGKWTEDSYEFTIGVNIGKSNETTYIQQANSVAESTYKSLLDSGFTEDIPQVGSRFNTDANGILKPMLAIGFNEKKIVFPCLCQPKYDGVRCTISKDSKGIHIISRNGKPYNIPHIAEWASANEHLLPLDGELYNHKELTFQEIISAVKRVSDITEKIRYVVYDKPVHNMTNKDRWNTLQSDFKGIHKDSPCYLSGYKICKTIDDVWEYHKECVSKGYEGVIIRNFSGEYEFGFRSSNLIKLKVFDDAEFEIVDVVEASGRDSGTAIFVCKCKDGVFNAKPQGTRELRKEYLERSAELIGKKVTIQYQGLSDDGIPRFPSAISIRDYE